MFICEEILNSRQIYQNTKHYHDPGETFANHILTKWYSQKINFWENDTLIDSNISDQNCPITKGGLNMGKKLLNADQRAKSREILS